VHHLQVKIDGVLVIVLAKNPNEITKKLAKFEKVLDAFHIDLIFLIKFNSLIINEL
jgi:hypothetical protein